MLNRVFAVSLAAFTGLFALLARQPAAPGQEPAAKAARGTKLDLTPESFAKLHALVRPHADEWRHLHVRWLTDVVAARKRAAQEDRPIVICYTGGAGYNEPLGVC
jgi:hypothetical protein